jgi:hypothetical protein
MEVRMYSQPQQYLDVVKLSLQRLTQRAGTALKMSGEIDGAQIHLPHEVYDLRADKISKGKDLTSAERTGVRYIVDGLAERPIAAEIPVDVPQSEISFANLNFGRFVQATKDGIQDLQGREGTGSYEVRLLRFAAIGLMALWLVDDAGQTSSMYPLDPAPPPLESRRLYSESDFLAAIRPLAEKRARPHKDGMVP